jgi:hypothetical protein
MTDLSFTSRSDAEPVRRVTPVSRVRRARSLILAAAGLSFVFSVLLWFLVDRQQGLFVGLWVPSILSFGALMLSGAEADNA